MSGAFSGGIGVSPAEPPKTHDPCNLGDPQPRTCEPVTAEPERKPGSPWVFSGGLEVWIPAIFPVVSDVFPATRVRFPAKSEMIFGGFSQKFSG